MDSTYNLNGGYKPTLKRFADLDGPDFFPTPPWAVEALMDNEEFEGDIWEPACGDGSMARVLASRGNAVIASDLYDRGFGEIGVDFLSSTRAAENIVTNPPYNAAEGFLRVGLSLATKKVALLLRLAFLEGGSRYRSIFSVVPPTRVWVFSERITFYPAGVQQQGSGTTAYAWFIWDKSAAQGSSQLCWLPPGYKAASAKEKPML
ncbi:MULTISPECIES: hypothetical protein [unclassified Bradyrhizobium]|uniref:hypothetical protein n=1 Tax=unclassified Bradyrhizobium TaxID=2631580 RepID=UPI001BA983D1|nr:MULTISPECIES: hypothetical protein [unclassified Bradyrhizobium]MBR1206590.1 hypothetical protein [Bradyrhizobium sp. AUGA SZCCT0124]MBR1315432.1 hypothetical protein [Bradyrhizobium sp. AUGA SZCCT0051]MBR1338506.1 hypothetical protein [Bradyrhizobium sp. AUGA SZCCT0105]MBR1356161.1 hypothetical protein [Bradyrhizobium sp. AUGA SZCCT0045]